MHIDLVVSRYDEDISWISDVTERLRGSITVHVYDKGATDVTPDVSASLETDSNVSVVVSRLPNVGRESHTYLEHVLRMRRTMTAGSSVDVTVFLQGRMEDHVPMDRDGIAEFVEIMVREAATTKRGESSNHACHTQYGSFNAIPDLRVSMFAGVGDSGIDFGHWFRSLIGPWPWANERDGPSWWQHGVFAIRTCRLMSSEVDDAYFVALRAEVDWHVNPEAGHYFERSWYFVFPLLQSEIERP